MCKNFGKNLTNYFKNPKFWKNTNCFKIFIRIYKFLFNFKRKILKILWKIANFLLKSSYVSGKFPLNSLLSKIFNNIVRNFKENPKKKFRQKLQYSLLHQKNFMLCEIWKRKKISSLSQRLPPCPKKNHKKTLKLKKKTNKKPFNLSSHTVGIPRHSRVSNHLSRGVSRMIRLRHKDS